ncbi:Uncharacterized membrane protein YphA, DoxX/SURF4 family [Bacillus sp. 491mf]|uniref:MauE/DoxX family redox-associated membrane protein n=1 Tax=Bacillus sp. 491mf TaxID=1761755 RepID=UPI0008E7B8EE|nr:MauE/DoxX family redox-associated membrane protein [Bacillus sp. 491mf]SFD08270.1 Uncharacterized membrane protein YphA, DoxX/SURF4 family [Bacillus sp. 491mf]
MNELILILRIIIGCLFISTALSKLTHFSEHIIIIKEYQIIPNQTAKFFATIEVIIELLCAFFLLVGLFSTIASLGLLILLTLYTLGISVNLLRKRTHISCGCGGMAGNHQLSWFLVLRNTILLGALYVLLQNETYLGSLQELFFNEQSGSYIFNKSAILSICISICFVFFFSIFRLFIAMHRHIEQFLEITKNLKGERKT